MYVHTTQASAIKISPTIMANSLLIMKLMFKHAHHPHQQQQYHVLLAFDICC